MGQTVISLSPMEVQHLDEVVALEEKCQQQPWSRGVFEDELKISNRVYLVAFSDRVVGFGGVMVVGEEAHITNLLVDPEERGRGMGRSLLRALISEAVALGTRHLTLEVRADNEAARSLYRRFGMSPVGLRPNYYQNEDALILWAHDIDRPGYLESVS